MSLKMEYRIATDNQLALLLKSLRKARKLTQAQLGERLGMSQRMVAKLEAHPDVASFGRVFQALSAMGVDVILKDRSQGNVGDEPVKKNKKAVQW
jgi:HTH-type transcriptional regulator / antitoxin HipB